MLSLPICRETTTQNFWRSCLRRCMPSTPDRYGLLLVKEGAGREVHQHNSPSQRVVRNGVPPKLEFFCSNSSPKTTVKFTNIALDSFQFRSITLAIGLTSIDVLTTLTNGSTEATSLLQWRQDSLQLIRTAWQDIYETICQCRDDAESTLTRNVAMNHSEYTPTSTCTLMTRHWPPLLQTYCCINRISNCFLVLVYSD